jgi:hypothetical protein
MEAVSLVDTVRPRGIALTLWYREDRTWWPSGDGRSSWFDCKLVLLAYFTLTLASHALMYTVFRGMDPIKFYADLGAVIFIAILFFSLPSNGWFRPIPKGFISMVMNFPWKQLSNSDGRSTTWESVPACGLTFFYFSGACFALWRQFASTSLEGLPRDCERFSWFAKGAYERRAYYDVDIDDCYFTRTYILVGACITAVVLDFAMFIALTYTNRKSAHGRLAAAPAAAVSYYMRPVEAARCTPPTGAPQTHWAAVV